MKKLLQQTQNFLPLDLRKSIDNQVSNSQFFTNRKSKSRSTSASRQNFRTSSQLSTNTIQMFSPQSILTHPASQQPDGKFYLPSTSSSRQQTQFSPRQSFLTHLPEKGLVKLQANKRYQRGKSPVDTPMVEYLPEIEGITNSVPEMLTPQTHHVQQETELCQIQQQIQIDPEQQVLISINSKHDPLEGKRQGSRHRGCTASAKRDKKLQARSQSPPQQTAGKKTRDLVLSQRYQMYGGGFNNNEMFNLLKEERFFSNLNRKSRADLAKIKHQTTEKIIEELIRERAGPNANLPNSNQLESIIQEVLGNQQVMKKQQKSKKKRETLGDQLKQKVVIDINKFPERRKKKQVTSERDNYKINVTNLESMSQNERNDEQMLLENGGDQPQKGRLLTNQEDSDEQKSQSSIMDHHELKARMSGRRSTKNADRRRNTFQSSKGHGSRKYLDSEEEFEELKNEIIKKDDILNQAYDLDKPHTQKMLIRMDSISNAGDYETSKAYSSRNNFKKSLFSHKSPSIPSLPIKGIKKIAMINGKKMAIVKRQQLLSTGAKGWPRVSGSKAKAFKDMKIPEKKLKRMNTTRGYVTPSEQSENSDGEEVTEFSRHFCKTAYLFKKMKLKKELKYGVHERISPKKNDESYFIQKQKTADYRTKQWRTYEKNFGVLTNYANKEDEVVLLRNQNINKKKMYNRIDYDTKTQIQKDDRFKPIERIRFNRRRTVIFELTERELKSPLKGKEDYFNWHSALKVQNLSLLMQKEIKNRQKGIALDKLHSLMKIMKVDNQEYDVSALALEEPKRKRSLDEERERKRDIRESQGALLRTKSENGNMVMRHINQINKEKYDQLNLIKKELQIQSQATFKRQNTVAQGNLRISYRAPIIGSSPFSNTANKHRLSVNFDHGGLKNISSLQGKNKLPYKISLQDHKNLSHSRSKSSSSSSSQNESSSGFLKSSYNHSEEVDKVEEMISPSNNWVKKESIRVPAQISQKRNTTKEQSSEELQQSYNSGKSSAFSKGKDEKSKVDEQVMKQMVKKVSSLMNRQKDSHMRSMTIMSINDLSEIENNMGNKKEEEVIKKLQNLNKEMENQMHDLMVVASPTEQILGESLKKSVLNKQGFPENFMRNISSKIFTTLKSEIQIDTLGFMAENNINELYLYTQTDFGRRNINSDSYKVLVSMIQAREKGFESQKLFLVELMTFIDVASSIELDLVPKGIKLNQNFLKFLLEDSLCNYEAYVSHTVNEARLDIKITYIERLLAAFQHDRLKLDLIGMVRDVKKEHNVLYKMQLGQMSEKELIDMFFKQHIPHRLFNSLYNKQYWFQVKRIRQKLIFSLPSHYHSEFLNENSIKPQASPLIRFGTKGGTSNAGNPSGRPQVKATPANRNLSIISSSRPYKCKYQIHSASYSLSLENCPSAEFSLVNKFFYFTILQRVQYDHKKKKNKPHYLMEVFLVDVDPRFRKNSELKAQARSVNETENDSYKLIQALVNNNENSFYSQNLTGLNFGGNNQSTITRVDRITNSAQSQNETTSAIAQSQIQPQQNPLRSLQTLKNAITKGSTNQQPDNEVHPIHERSKTNYIPRISIVKEDNTVLASDDPSFSITNGPLSPVISGNTMNQALKNTLTIDTKFQKEQGFELSPIPSQLEDNSQIERRQIPNTPLSARRRRNGKLLSMMNPRSIKIQSNLPEETQGIDDISNLQSPDIIRKNTQEMMSQISHHRKDSKITIVVEQSSTLQPPQQKRNSMKMLNLFNIQTPQFQQTPASNDLLMDPISATLYKKFGRETEAINEESILSPSYFSPDSPIQSPLKKGRQNGSLIRDKFTTEVQQVRKQQTDGFWFKNEYIYLEEQKGNKFDVFGNNYDLSDDAFSQDSDISFSLQSPRLSSRPRTRKGTEQVPGEMTKREENEKEAKLSFISLESFKGNSELGERQKLLLEQSFMKAKQKGLLLSSCFSEWNALNSDDKKESEIRMMTPKNKALKYETDEYIFDQQTKKKRASRFGWTHQQYLEDLKALKKLRKKKNNQKKNEELMQIAKIFQAIQTNNLHVVNDIISRFIGIDLEHKDSQGNTFLNYAAQMGNYEITELLLRKGSNVNTVNNTRNTPLHYAHAYNFRKVFDLLLQNKADQTILNDKGKSPWEGIM